MIGSLKWNMIFGILAGILSFMLSASNHNLFLTSLVRGFISFGIAFTLMFLFRWLLALVVRDGAPSTDEAKTLEMQPGMTIDLTTPAEDNLLPADDGREKVPSTRQAPAEQNSTQSGSAKQVQEFRPFEPPRLTLKKQDDHIQGLDPETAAKAIRRLTED